MSLSRLARRLTPEAGPSSTRGRFLGAPLASLLASALLALPASAPAGAATLRPPGTPGSEFAAQPACPAPRPGRASCLALAVRPRTASARSRVHDLTTRSAPGAGLFKASECSAYQSSCFTPAQLRDAYFPGEAAELPAGTTQTIALVDAYNDPSAEADLGTYSSEFGLPACTAANGCFKQVGQTGGEGSANLPFPKTRSELETYAKGTARQRERAEDAEGWALETSTDIEMARAVCHNCHILLVGAESPEYTALEAAEDTAAAQAGEVSNSWGGPEAGGDSAAFDHPGVVITASAGDDGYLNWDLYETRTEAGSAYFQGADYPATSPHVVAVGGTSLTLSTGGGWQSESPWNGEGAGGSGCSESLLAPQWQLEVADWSAVGCGQDRASADVSAVADPATGVDVYDSLPYPQEPGKTTVLHWVPIGGTSVASPIVASMFALAGGAHGVAYPAQTLYSHLGSSLLHDVSGGGNGKCDDTYQSCSGSMDQLSPQYPLDCGAGAWICNATAGYDGPTGVGTPNGIAALEPLGAGERQGKGSEEATGKESSEKSGTETPTREESTHTEQAPEEPPAGEGPQTPNGAEAPAVAASSGQSGSALGPAGTAGTKGQVGASPNSMLISRLALTARSALLLHRGGRGLLISRVEFSFALTHPATVRALLAVRVRTHSGAHWRTLSSTRFAAGSGVHKRHLGGARALAAGLYRLTLLPLGGRPRALTLRVG